MTATLYVHLLGQFRLLHGAAQVAGLHTARCVSLLAYLILNRNAPQPRQQVAYRLWPDSTEAQARANLRNLLHQLRRAFPLVDQYLCVSGQSLQWLPQAPVRVDVAEFEDAAERGALGEAVALYRGDLLPECYDDWVLAERDRLQQMFVGALDQLIQQLEAQKDYLGAITQAQRLLRHDPLREATYRNLMRLHALNGDRAAALHTYHTCVTTLQRELAVGPSPPTRAMYERLMKSAPAAAPETASTTPLAAATTLVGRRAEWQRLLAAWSAAAAGKPHLVLLAGEAGIGKTKLAEELLSWAERQGVTVASARCYAAEGSLAYGPVATWLRARPLPALEVAWLSEVARVLPELLAEHPNLPAPGPLTEAWQRQRLFDALARAILGQPQPLLLLVEDLHWCDPPSLEWLHYLLRFDPHARLLVLGTIRPDEAAARPPLVEWTAALRHEAQLEQIELGPLDAAETAALAAQVVGREVDPAIAAALFRETEGNPLFTVEMARAGLDGLRLEPELRAEAAPRSSSRLPPKVRDVIAGRLSRLSPTAHDLVGLAAATGRDFTFEVLKHADHGTESDLVRGLDELWRRRIIREHGDKAYDFSHDKLREVAYSELSVARRRLLHRHVAEALEAVYSGDLDAVAGQIGTHYEQAGQPDAAVRYYWRAAQAARRIFAHAAAQPLLDRTLTLLGWSTRLVADGCANDNDVSILPALDAIDVLLAYSDTQLVLGQGEAARSPLPRALDLARRSGDASRTVQTLLQLSWVAAFRGDFSAAEAALEEAVPLARAASGDGSGRAALAQALSALGNLAWRQGRFGEATAALDEALELARTLGDATLQMQALSRLGKIYASRREPALAQSHQEAGSQLARQTGNHQQLAIFLANLSALALDAGRYAEAGEYCREALDVNRAVGSRHLDLILRLNLGWTALGRGQPREAQDHFLEALRQSHESGATPEALGALVGLAQVRAQSGDAPTALAWLTLALHHPAVDTNVREVAEPALCRLRADLSPGVIALGEAEGRALRLENVAAALLAEGPL